MSQMLGDLCHRSCSLCVAPTDAGPQAEGADGSRTSPGRQSLQDPTEEECRQKRSPVLLLVTLTSMAIRDLVLPVSPFFLACTQCPALAPPSNVPNLYLLSVLLCPHPQECAVTPESENLTLSSSGAVDQSSCTGTPLSSTISSPEGTYGRSCLCPPLSPQLSWHFFGDGSSLWRPELEKALVLSP